MPSRIVDLKWERSLRNERDKKVNISKAIFKFQSYKYIPSTFDKCSHEIPIIIIMIMRITKS